MSDEPTRPESASGPQVLPDLREKVAARKSRAKPGAKAGDGAKPPSPEPDDAALLLGVDCPIRPVGHMLPKPDKPVYVLIDDQFQLRFTPPKLDKSLLYSLCGHAWLIERFPMFKNDGSGDKIPNKFNQDMAERTIIHACKMQGRVRIDDVARSRGSHVTRRGALVLHCGDHLVVAGERPVRPGDPLRAPYARDPGVYERLLFPLDDTLMAPADAAASVADARDCLSHLNGGGWAWKGPARFRLDDEDIDIFAYLVMCWTMSAKLPGALKYRPVLVTQGPSKQGKSELLSRQKDMIGEGWYYTTDDPSEAGISSVVGKARIAVLLDEFEGKNSSPEFIKTMFEMMLRSFNAGKKTRGSAEQVAVESELHCSMQGSSVLLPKMRPQDRNRMIVVEIGTRAEQKTIYQRPALFEGIAPRLHRRLAEQWHRYAETLTYYQNRMAERGLEGRDRDTYGTALACGDLALFDGTPCDLSEAGGEAGNRERVNRLIDCIVPLVGTLQAENIDHPERAMAALLSSHLPSPGGAVQQNVGQWIEKALIALGSDDSAGWAIAKVQLASHGMRLCQLKPDHATSKAGVIALEDLAVGYLAIAGPTHEGMAKLFKATEFNQGRWPEALGRVVHTVLDRDGKETGVMPAIKGKIPKIGGANFPCTLVPLAWFIDLYEISEQIAVAREAAVFGEAEAEKAAKARRGQRGINE